MVPHPLQDESANAEILGVVILIGIFAITAGIISATTLSGSPPSKTPAASIEITGTSDGIRIAHLGGDLLPEDSFMMRGVTSGGTIVLMEGTDIGTIVNGFSAVIDGTGNWVAAVLIWKGNSGESVIASWDPTGSLPPEGGSVAVGTLFVPHIQPSVPTPNTTWNATIDRLTADFTIDPTDAVTGSPVQFKVTSTGTITNWSWFFGDGGTSTDKNPTHPYLSAGTYSVTLTVSNMATGESATIVKSLSVRVTGSPPDFDLTATEGGNVLTVTCTDMSQSAPTLWKWTATDGLNPSNVTTIGPLARNQSYNPGIQTFTFYNSGGELDNTCTIQLTIWSPYFDSPVSITKTVIVHPPLQADFEPNVTVGVSPQTVRFFDKSIGIPQTWLWDFGDGTTSTEQNPVHIFTVGPGEIRTFHVTLTVAGWDQTSTATHDITVYPPVVADFKAVPTEGEAPLTVAFTDISTGFVSGWRWNFGDGTNSTEQNPVHIFSSFGAYDVTLFVERTADPHSADEKTIPVYIRVGPVVTANFTANTTSGPSPLTVQFTNTSTSANPSVAPIIRWSWDFGDSTTSTEENPMHTYATSGNYTVSLTAANAYRYATMTKVGYIRVFYPVTANFTANQTAGPVPMTVQFTDQSAGDPTNWSWDLDGNGTSDSSIKNPLATYVDPGDYVVNLTAWNHLRPDLTSTKLETVRVYAAPVASFTIDPMATPLWMNFTDTSTGNPFSWSWDFGDGTNSTVRGPIAHGYSTTGIYNVTLRVLNPAGNSTTSRQVTVT